MIEELKSSWELRCDVSGCGQSIIGMDQADCEQIATRASWDISTPVHKCSECADGHDVNEEVPYYPDTHSNLAEAAQQAAGMGSDFESQMQLKGDSLPGITASPESEADEEAAKEALRANVNLLNVGGLFGNGFDGEDN